MYHPTRLNIAREHIIAAEVMKLELRLARERAADPKSPLDAAERTRWGRRGTPTDERQRMR
jgi:hypothetical protein